MSITELQFKIYDHKLKVLKEIKKPKADQDYKAAAALGDHSENAELDAAKSALTQIKLEIERVSNLLKSEVVPYDNSANITIGSLVEISSPCLQNEDNPEGKFIRLVADNGDFLIEPVLNTKSELGRAVLGNLSGDYEVKGNKFKVTKIQNPDFNEFSKIYLDEDEAIEKLYGGM